MTSFVHREQSLATLLAPLQVSFIASGSSVNGDRHILTVLQVLMTVSAAVVRASHICADIADLDHEHIGGRTEIAGHR